jgi:GT2 family glycosyltransferase
MKNLCKLGIVIVNYNGSKLTIDCINSLQKSTFTDFQVYIVDNGSKEEEIEMLKSYCNKQTMVTLFDTKVNNGIATGNNIGVAAALKGKCKYIMLLNNDTIVDEAMVEILVNKAEQGNRLCTPVMFYFDEPNKIWCAGGKLNRMKGMTAHFFENQYIEDVKLEEKEVEYVPTCCLLIESSLFEEMGNFDANYFLYYDDTDFIYRLNKKGYKIQFVPSAKLWHKVSSSSGGAESKLSVYYLNRNRFYFIRKNFTGLQKVIAMSFTYGTRFIKMINPRNRKTIYEAVKDYHESKMGWKDISKI